MGKIEKKNITKEIEEFQISCNEIKEELSDVFSFISN
jgi:hypothetical protein